MLPVRKPTIYLAFVALIIGIGIIYLATRPEASDYAVVRNIVISDSSDSELQFADSLSPFEEVYRPDGITLELEITQFVAAELLAKCPSTNTGKTMQNAFAVEVAGKKLTAYISDYSAALYAADEIHRRLQKSNGTLQKGLLCDAPDNRIRALHIVSRYVPVPTVEEVIRQARAARFNTLIIHLADGVQLNSRAVKAIPEPWTREDLVHIVDFARKNGLDVIPQIALLTHQEKFFGRTHPDLMWNRVTYDPNNPRVYELVYEYIDEVIDLIQPRAIHIGHDELAGLTPATRKQWLGPDDEVLPSDLYLKDVRQLSEFLTSRDIQTWMWGDMLASPTNFPDMHPALLNGINGFSEIRTEIPKNIVICDWQYYESSGNFDSIDYLVGEGYKVLGATWKKEKNIRSFSKHMADLDQSGEGMIATTWFHLQRKEMELVSDIIEYSGQHFWVSD